MLERAARWVGGALAVIAAIAMGVYFTAVGLDEADKIASAIGAFIGLAGLVLAIYGTVRARRLERVPQQPSAAQRAGGAVHNEIHGGTLQGPVIQGRDFGQVTLGFPPPSAPPSDSPDTSAQG